MRKKTTAKAKACKCIALVNEKLEAENTRIVTEQTINFASMRVSPEYVLIATERIEKGLRKGPAKLVAAYCPFCGKLLGEAGA
jgi:predicted molibdopterin-dependent oxidoreductase YjgC